MLTFLIVFAGWMVSLCFHEFGHAIVAYYGGDYTVRDKGYLTLNPLKYTHPLYSIIMPLAFLALGGIGLPGGAVYIEDDRLRSRGWKTAVSLAGVTMTTIVAFVLWLPLGMGLMPLSLSNTISCAFAFLVFLQVTAIILNLLPIPPLDGFRAISPWLRWDIRDKLLRHSQAIFIGFFVVLWYVRPVGRALFGAAFAICDALGVDRSMVWAGLTDFRFWQR